MKDAKVGASPTEANRQHHLGNREYVKELARLHVELVKLQQWVVATGAKICVLFEGRDGAGKGGTIKAITERVSPRIFHVVALPAPSDRENPRCICNVTCRIFPRAAKLSCSIAVGTTAPEWNGSWGSAPKNRQGYF